jgi:pimeloyl-ACP methyl ester carboxylesterase
MVCIHGLMDTWRTWQPILPGLEAHHDVLAITLPGHMHGPPLPENVDLTAGTVADAVDREMDAAGFATAHLVGNSLGGWLALELAARGRARSVVALSPAGGWYRGSPVERRVARFFRMGHRAARVAAPFADQAARLPGARTFGLRMVVSQPSNISPPTIARMIRGAAACSIVVVAMDILMAEGWEEPLGPIDCPVRIAWGTKDRVIPLSSGSARFPTLVPDAEFVELDGLGHVPMSDDPDLVLATIEAVAAPVDSAMAISRAG